MITFTRISLATMAMAIIFSASAASAQTSAKVQIQATAKTTAASAKTATSSTKTVQASSTASASTSVLKDGKVQALAINSAQLRTAVTARVAELDNVLKGITATKKVQLQGDAKTQVTNRIKSVFNNLTIRLSRLQSADAKLAIRINEEMAAGINASSTIALYSTAQAALNATRTNLEAARTESTNQINGTTSKEALHALVTNVEVGIKTTADDYRKTLNALEIAYPSGPAKAIPAPANASSSISVNGKTGK